MRFVLGARYGGGAGFAHGGVIAILLDEAMGKISKLIGERAVTAELNMSIASRFRWIRKLWFLVGRKTKKAATVFASGKFTMRRQFTGARPWPLRGHRPTRDCAVSA